MKMNPSITRPACCTRRFKPTWTILLALLVTTVTALAVEPGDPPGAESFLSALAKERAGKPDEAVDIFRKLEREQVALSPYAAIRAADLLARQARHAGEAEQLLRRYADTPEFPAPWTRLAKTRLARLLADTGRHAEAERYWKEVFSGLPSMPWFMEDEEWRRIENLLSTPETAMAALSLLRPRAESMFIQRRKQAAEALLKLPDPHARALGARAMLRSGMMDETRALFNGENVQFHVDGMGSMPWRALQQALSATNPPAPETRATLKNLLEANAEHPWLEAWLTFCARSAAGSNAWDTARMFVDALLEISPGDDVHTVEAVYWLAGRLREARETARAEAVYKQVIDRYPGNGRVFWCWMNLGDMARDAERWADAAERYAKAAEATSRVDYRARARWREAEAAGRLHDIQRQQAALKAAAACGPGPYEAHRAVARLKDPEARSLPGAPAGLLAYRPTPHRIDPAFHPASEAEQRVWFFARHGLPEGEWETLHLVLFPPAGANRRALLGFLCDAGYMHTVVNLTLGERADFTDRDDTALCLDYPVAYWPIVSRLARAYNLDPFLLLAVARQESTFRPSLISWAGAVGVMQVLPKTARWMVSKDPDLPQDAPTRLMEPEFSIHLGAAYLRKMLDQFNGNLVYAVAAYNGGPGNCSKWVRAGGHLPPESFIETIPLEETRDYVKKVLGNLAAYHSLWSPP
ncbi:MAG TPA: transglycosylase SLT domain-containing protein [Candidatus Hydrogenedentes bacterium]|nr:transglycosylase SLT domain-containing protein [Candidatus Hydrogenedentota bacterium]